MLTEGWRSHEVGDPGIFANQQSEDEDERPSPTPSRFPRVRGQFALRYDDESMVSKLDIGGEDQAVKYVPLERNAVLCYSCLAS